MISLKTVARLNDYEIKLVNLQGELVWHATMSPTSCPVADGEVHALLIEPASVVNTGDVTGP